MVRRLTWVMGAVFVALAMLYWWLLFTDPIVAQVPTAPTPAPLSADTIRWDEGGIQQSITFTDTVGFWFTFTEGQATTTLGWTIGTSTQQFHQFSPDSNAWSVNTVRGDLNNDGVLDVLDIIAGLQCIVGIMEC